MYAAYPSSSMGVGSAEGTPSRSTAPDMPDVTCSRSQPIESALRHGRSRTWPSVSPTAAARSAPSCWSR